MEGKLDDQRQSFEKSLIELMRLYSISPDRLIGLIQEMEEFNQERINDGLDQSAYSQDF